MGRLFSWGGFRGEVGVISLFVLHRDGQPQFLSYFIIRIDANLKFKFLPVGDPEFSVNLMEQSLRV